jgi:hypothetical protein
MPTEAIGRILVPAMSVSAAITPAALASPRVRRRAPRRVATRPARRLELDIIAAHWQRAFDAHQRARVAATGLLPATEVARRQRELKLERLDLEASLTRLAQVVRVGPASRR